MAAQHSLEGKEQGGGERGEKCSHFALGGHKLCVFTHVAPTAPLLAWLSERYSVLRPCAR